MQHRTGVASQDHGDGFVPKLRWYMYCLTCGMCGKFKPTEAEAQAEAELHEGEA